MDDSMKQPPVARRRTPSAQTDAWVTTAPTLAELRLAEVLMRGKAFDKADPEKGGIAIVAGPPGFRAMCRDLLAKHHMSFSMLVRLGLMHGAVVIAADPRMLKLKRVHLRLRSDAMDSGNPAALARLDQLHPFELVRPHPYRTTLSVVPWVRGELAELADLFSVPLGKIAVIAVLVSIATLPNNRGYQRIVKDELDAFWDAVERRTAQLSLDL